MRAIKLASSLFGARMAALTLPAVTAPVSTSTAPAAAAAERLQCRRAARFGLFIRNAHVSMKWDGDELVARELQHELPEPGRNPRRGLRQPLPAIQTDEFPRPRAGAGGQTRRQLLRVARDGHFRCTGL